MSRLFVGGISWSTTEESLLEAFQAFGPVREVKIVVDRETGRSKGFGFVSFHKEEDAVLALEGMNGKTLDGRSLRVDVAEDTSPRRGESRSIGTPGIEIINRRTRSEPDDGTGGSRPPRSPHR